MSVIFHTDGAVAEAVEGLIDADIEGLRAWQFSAKGMDPAVLKNRFGDRLCFEGRVSVQTTLSLSKMKDVRAEPEELIRVLGKDGGYILGPFGCQTSAAIQAGTPPKNIVAMFDTAASQTPF